MVSRAQESASPSPEFTAGGQLALALSRPALRPTQASTPAAIDRTLTQAHWRYCTRREAATYLRCSLRFFDQLPLPFAGFPR